MPLFVFQILVAVFVIVAALIFLRGGGAKQQAIRRLAFMFFMAVAGFSVFFPSAWTSVANFLGVGRGADLLLYLLVLTFFGFVASTFRKFNQQEAKITELARQLALSNAKKLGSGSDD